MKEILESALSQGIASVVVVAIFLLLYKWLDNRKKSDSEKFVIKVSTTLDKLSLSLLELSTFVTDITKNIVNKDKDKCKAAIEDSMYASAMRIISLFLLLLLIIILILIKIIYCLIFITL